MIRCAKSWQFNKKLLFTSMQILSFEVLKFHEKIFLIKFELHEIIDRVVKPPSLLKLAQSGGRRHFSEYRLFLRCYSFSFLISPNGQMFFQKSLNL